MIFLPALHMAACASFKVLLLVSLLFGSGVADGSLILAAVGPGVPSLRQKMPGPRAGGLGGRRSAARWSERLTGDGGRPLCAPAQRTLVQCVLRASEPEPATSHPRRPKAPCRDRRAVLSSPGVPGS